MKGTLTAVAVIAVILGSLAITDVTTNNPLIEGSYTPNITGK